jgi:2,5-dihydroxypyridine 5,6-dioxygenase
VSNYQIDDMVQGVKNFIEATGIHDGDKVLFLADTRSDQASLQACALGLKMIGAKPIVFTMDRLARYSRVPDEAIGAAAHTDVIVLTWPVFITAGLNAVRNARTPTSDFDPSTAVPGQPKLVYFECAPGILASSYAQFPNELLWAIAKRIKEIALKGKKIRVTCPRGTDLVSTYDSSKLFAMQTRPVEPGGRCHFPWGRCGIFHGAGEANGVVYLDTAQGVDGVFEEPMRWVVEKNVIVECEGGEIAQHMKKLERQYKQPIHFCEIMFGFHPHVPQKVGLDDYMHWAFNSKWAWFGIRVGEGLANARGQHLDGPCFWSSVYIDDQLVMERGRLTLCDDPEIREIASKYGDPDDLLEHITHAQ